MRDPVTGKLVGAMSPVELRALCKRTVTLNALAADLGISLTPRRRREQDSMAHHVRRRAAQLIKDHDNARKAP